MRFAFVGTLALLAPISACLGQQVLFYTDTQLLPAQGVYAKALDQLHWSYTTASDESAFRASLGAASWTHVVFVHNTTGGDAATGQALASFAASHPASIVLVTDARGPSPETAYLSQLGFSYGGPNASLISPLPGSLFDGLSPASLANPGWNNIFSYGTIGGDALALNNLGNPSIARQGRVFFNGFASDVFTDANLGASYVIRELTVPSPSVAIISGMYAFVSARRRSRK